ncbi:MAG: hypothetical protein ACREYE_00820, partial [Gammaproteobacteria bacterium]
VCGNNNLNTGQTHLAIQLRKLSENWQTPPYTNYRASGLVRRPIAAARSRLEIVSQTRRWTAFDRREAVLGVHVQGKSSAQAMPPRSWCASKSAKKTLSQTNSSSA